MSDFTHRSVLLAEAVALISPRPGGVYVDCTLGGGGHSEAILQADEGARVISGGREELAKAGRAHTRRTMPV